MPKKPVPIEIDAEQLKRAFDQLRVDTAQYISDLLENLDDMPLPEGTDRTEFTALLQEELNRCRN